MLVLALAACDSDSGAKSKPDADAKPEADAKSDAGDDEAKPTEEESMGAMVEHDLTDAAPRWAGWVAKGPKDSEVRAFGDQGARLFGAVGRFDVMWQPGATDLAVYKEQLQLMAEKSGGAKTLELLRDEAGHLEWSLQEEGTTQYAFMLHMEVAGEKLTCSTRPMGGVATPQALQAHREACQTLRKR